MLVHQIGNSKANLVERPDRFTGTVHWQVISESVDEKTAEVLAIFFEAGARSRPQRHSAEEVLYVVDGRGVLAVENEVLFIRAGDIAVVPAGTWHWHGATRSTGMCQIVVGLSGETEWLIAENDEAKTMELT